MSINVGINGFGRMGRLGLRAGFDHPEYRLTQINEAQGTAETASHLLEFDTVHGCWDRDISSTEDTLRVGGECISISFQNKIEAVDWSGCDIVIDSSGAYRTREALQPYFDQGVKKVIVACPIKDADTLNIVMGCNDDLYDLSLIHI